MPGQETSMRCVRFALVSATLFLTACSSPSHSRPGAAEPALAPTGGPTPSGTVIAVGASPEGIVYDAHDNLLAVAVHHPDRLLLLDATTLALRRSVPLPGSARHLQLATPAGPVLVPVESAGELVEVTLPGGQTRATKVGKQPHDASGAADAKIVVGNEFGHSISILRNGVVLTTVPGVRQPGGVIGDGTSVAVLDVNAFTVNTFDLTTDTRTAVIAAGKGPTHGVLVSRGRLVVADTRGNTILVFGLHPLRAISSLPLSGTPYGMAVDPTTDTVWVTLTARNQVVGLDVAGATPKQIAHYPTIRQPNTLAVSPGSHSIWITGTDAGVVELIRR